MPCTTFLIRTAMVTLSLGSRPVDHAHAATLWRAVCGFRQRFAPALLVQLLRGLDPDGLMTETAQLALLEHCLCSTVAALLPTDADYARSAWPAAWEAR